MLLTTPSSDIVFSITDVAQLLLLSFSVGGLYATVRANHRETHTLKKATDEQIKANADATKERIEKLEERHSALEVRFLGAIENLGHNIANLTTELKTALAVTNQRLDQLEERR